MLRLSPSPLYWVLFETTILQTIVRVFTAVAQHVGASPPKETKKPTADSSFKDDENPPPIDTTYSNAR